MTDSETIVTAPKSATGQKLSFFEYLYVFVLIIYAANATKLVNATSVTDTPVAVLVPVILSGILALKWKIVIDRQFFYVIGGFFIYFVTISIKFSDFRPTYFVFYFLQFFIIYSTVRSLKIKLFRVFEDIVFYLTSLGMLLWIIQTVMGGDTLYGYFRSVAFIRKYSSVSQDGLNAILYSIQPAVNSFIYSNVLPRNSGFAWEPGVFAVFICLALYCNLFINNIKGKIGWRFWLFSVALVSTQSTTGYLAYLVIVFFYMYNKMSRVILVLFPVILAILVMIFSLPFMSNKIVRLISETNELDAMVVRTIGRKGEPYTPQRFSSLLITMIDFKNNPVLGLGGKVEEGWTMKIGARISPITGIGNLLAQFGLVGCVFFVFSTLASSLFFARYLKMNIRLLLFIVILFTSISYSLIFFPLIMCFWMFRLFTPSTMIPKEIKKVEIQSDLTPEEQ